MRRLMIFMPLEISIKRRIFLVGHYHHRWIDLRMGTTLICLVHTSLWKTCIVSYINRWLNLHRNYNSRTGDLKLVAMYLYRSSFPMHNRRGVLTEQYDSELPWQIPIDQPITYRVLIPEVEYISLGHMRTYLLAAVMSSGRRT